MIFCKYIKFILIIQEAKSKINIKKLIYKSLSNKIIQKSKSEKTNKINFILKKIFIIEIELSILMI